MRHLLTILAALLVCAPAHAQTLKSLMFNLTNGQVVANTGTNVLTFTNDVSFGNGDLTISGMQISGSAISLSFEDGNFAGDLFMGGAISFGNATNSSTTRANLGFSTNLNALWTATNASNARSAVGLGATWLTNTNVTNFRTAVGLGEANSPQFQSLKITNNGSFIDVTSYGIIGYDAEIDLEEKDLSAGSGYDWNFSGSGIVAAGTIEFVNATNAATTRTNLGLGATNNVTFANVAATAFGESGSFTFRSDDGTLRDGTNIMYSVGSGTRFGDSVIRQNAANNGLLFVYRTNNEPFLGLANLIASNNTTVSNETLFRVGVAEATNRSAQFGFRATNTNGNGVAVFSVFGFNALMQIGADASTNAVIYSGGGTNNEVMTLIRDGATEFARPLRFSTNASTRPSTNAPANTTNVAAWVEMQIGTNSYRVPLYQ